MDVLLKALTKKLKMHIIGQKSKTFQKKGGLSIVHYGTNGTIL